MTQKEIRKRIRERLELKLPVRVRCRETPQFEWTEITRLIDVTPFGAGFTLKRPVEKGRLLHMTIPMPRQLRVFDHVEDQYKIWALVRYLRAPAVEGNKVPLFEVGVAFVGNVLPGQMIVIPTVTMRTFKTLIVMGLRLCQSDQYSRIAIWKETMAIDLNQENITRNNHVTSHHFNVKALIDFINLRTGVSLSWRSLIMANRDPQTPREFA